MIGSTASQPPILQSFQNLIFFHLFTTYKSHLHYINLLHYQHQSLSKKRVPTTQIFQKVYEDLTRQKILIKYNKILEQFTVLALIIWRYCGENFTWRVLHKELGVCNWRHALSTPSILRPSLNM